MQNFPGYGRGEITKRDRSKGIITKIKEDNGI